MCQGSCRNEVGALAAMRFARDIAPLGTPLEWRRRRIAAQRFSLLSVQAMDIGFGRGHLDTQFKHQGPDLDLIAVAEKTFTDETHAIDQRAVGAAEVAQADFMVVHAHQAILAAYPGTVGPDVAFATAPKDKFTPGKEQGFALRLPLHDNEVHLHNSLTSPSSAGPGKSGWARPGWGWARTS